MKKHRIENISVVILIFVIIIVIFVICKSCGQ
jgi:hypothetical protein